MSSRVTHRCDSVIHDSTRVHGRWSSMRRQHNSRYPAKLVHGFGILCCGIAASASASECGSDRILSAYLDPSIPSYENGKSPPTDLERVLMFGGYSCQNGYLLRQSNWTSVGPHVICPIEKTLPDTLSYKANNRNVIKYLNENNFKCVESNKYMLTCYYAFRVKVTPRHPFTGDRMNPDIETTYITQVCVGVMRSDDIRVNFFSLVRQIPEFAKEPR